MAFENIQKSTSYLRSTLEASMSLPMLTLLDYKHKYFSQWSFMFIVQLGIYFQLIVHLQNIIIIEDGYT